MFTNLNNTKYLEVNFLIRQQDLQIKYSQRFNISKEGSTMNKDPLIQTRFTSNECNKLNSYFNVHEAYRATQTNEVLVHQPLAGSHSMSFCSEKQQKEPSSVVKIVRKNII